MDNKIDSLSELHLIVSQSRTRIAVQPFQLELQEHYIAEE